MTTKFYKMWYAIFCHIFTFTDLINVVILELFKGEKLGDAVNLLSGLLCLELCCPETYFSQSFAFSSVFEALRFSFSSLNPVICRRSVSCVTGLECQMPSGLDRGGTCTASFSLITSLFIPPSLCALPASSSLAMSLLQEVDWGRGAA